MLAHVHACMDANYARQQLQNAREDVELGRQSSKTRSAGERYTAAEKKYAAE